MGDERIELLLGDITGVEVDAIVNAANNDLQLGGGVAGAIRRKGGPSIQEECNRIGTIPLGEAAATGAGRLKAKVVIHAASMSLGGRTTEEHLAASTANCLKRAEERDVKTIAFPAVGTGIAGFPADACARLMVRIAREHLASPDNSIEKVLFVLYDRPTYDAFAKALEDAA
jgi:O-acetyl-ADP-ribose deacetylase (regulator of RNase III)